MTVNEMVQDVLNGVGEKEGIFHTTTNARWHLSAAELFLGMVRAVTERTANLNLVYNQGIYTIHSTLPDFIYPLRVSIVNRQLYQSTLSKIVSADPNWLKTIGSPKNFFMAGATLFALYPTPPSSSLVAKITYVAVPPILSAVSSSTVVGPEWHEAMVNYAQAILLAKEHRYDLATRQLKMCMDKIGLSRDRRFGPPETKGEQGKVPLHQPLEVQLG